MSGHAPLPTVLRWMAQGTSLFVAAVAALDDAQVRQPSALPGWSRAHVLAHVGFNARALLNLVHWARTGEERPMYASREQRDADIARGAGWPAEQVRTFARETAAELDAALAAMDEADWQAPVVTAAGRQVPASEIPWMRTREVAIHAVDLDVGIGFSAIDEACCLALVDDVVTRRSALGNDPAVVVRTGGRTWEVAGDGPARTVSGPPHAVAAWLTGRTAGADLTGEAVELSPWL